MEVDADPDGEPRYRLLPTIAAYAREQLESEGEADAAESRREAVLRSTARKTRTLVGRKQVDALARDAGELQVLFAKLATDGRTADALELASDLAPLWSVRGLFQGPGTVFAELLDTVARSNEGVDEAIEARAMVWWAILAVHAPSPARDRDVIRRRLGRGLELARTLDDPALLLFALNAVVVAVFVTGDMAGAAAATAEGLALATATGDRSAQARFGYRAAIVARATGDDARAAALAGAALTKTIEDGDLRADVLHHRRAHGDGARDAGDAHRHPDARGHLPIRRAGGGSSPQRRSLLARLTAVKLEAGEIEAGAAVGPSRARAGRGPWSLVREWLLHRVARRGRGGARRRRRCGAPAWLPDADRNRGLRRPGPGGHRALSGGDRSRPQAARGCRVRAACR